jgi:glycosyltransferase involved in cell wall biosynthesis
MASGRPLVSVGLPVYNGEKHLPQALETLAAQDHPELEIVVCDNASTDGTEQICRDLAARDPRVRYHRQPVNLGTMANFTDVFTRARGAYFMWAGHHDRWHPAFVSTCLAALQANPEVVLAYPVTEYVDADGRAIDSFGPAVDTVSLPLPERLARITEIYPICAIYGLMRVEALRTLTSPWGPALKRPLDHVCPDVLILMRMACLGSFALVPGSLYFNRSFGKDWRFEDKLEQLVPGRGHRARWAWWSFLRDLGEVIWSADMSAVDKARLSALALKKWALPHRNRLLYELDVLGVGRGAKRLVKTWLRPA